MDQNLTTKIRFYSDLDSNEFRSKLGEQIQKLDEQRIRYLFFKSTDIIPKMSFHGTVTIGMDDIIFELNNFLTGINIESDTD